MRSADRCHSTRSPRGVPSSAPCHGRRRSLANFVTSHYSRRPAFGQGAPRYSVCRSVICQLEIVRVLCTVHRVMGGVPAVRGVGWSAGHRRAMMSMWLVGEHGGSMAGWRPGEFETSVVRYRHVPPEYTAPRHEHCLEPKTIVQTSRSLLTINRTCGTAHHFTISPHATWLGCSLTLVAPASALSARPCSSPPRGSSEIAD